MPGPGLIGSYLAELSAQLPPPIVAELADGLDQAYQRYLGQGLGPGAAAEAALAEFGEPQVVVAAFVRASPGRRAARTLLAAGPVVGACWGMALIINRAWAWPVPVSMPVLLGVALIAVIALLVAAACGGSYRSAGRAAAAGCIGTATLDITMVIAVAVAAPAALWPIIVAMTASLARITFTTRSLHSILVG